MDLTRKRRTRLYEDVAEKIRNLIVSGNLSPGDQLLPERQLAEKLGVSRSAVREALTALVSQGLLEITPGSGAFVREVQIEDLIDPFANVVLKEIKDIFDLLEARIILEGGAARLAAERADGADLYYMHELILDMEKDVEEGRSTDESDSEFHYCVARSSHNPVVIHLMAVLMGLMKEYYGPSRKRLVEMEKNRHLWSRQHVQIYEAIKNKDPERAAQAVEEHLQTTIAELRKLKGVANGLL